MTQERPTASTINDDQLDILLDALDKIEKRHRTRQHDHEEDEIQRTPYCIECAWPGPCSTLRIIQETREKLKERG